MYFYQLYSWNNVKAAEPDHLAKIGDEVSKFLILFMRCSWLVYIIAAFVILVCAYFYLFDRWRRADIMRRRHIMQRAQERPPQKRRPGAIYREHQIYRHIIRSIGKYMKNPPPVCHAADRQSKDLRRYLRRRNAEQGGADD